MSASIKAGLNNDMHLMTDGVTRAYIDGNGKVGIGTDSPSSRLHISQSTDSVLSGLQIRNTANSSSVYIYQDGADTKYDTGTSGNQIFRTGSSERMRIESSGIVTTPNQPAFSIYGNTNPNWTSDVIYLGHTGSGAAAFDTNIGNHFSYTTGKFTAPVAGTYFFSFSATTGDANSHFIDIHKNGARVGGHVLSYGYQYLSATNTCILTLASGDYIEARRRAANYSLYSVNFSGYLIG